MTIEKSPFYHAWEDQHEAERYQIHAREIYAHYRSYQMCSRSGHVDYGKWLIASMLAVHGGAIYAISGLKNSVLPQQIPGLITGASWNLAGMVLILFAGFFAWINFQAAERLYDRWSNPAMLYRSDQFPKDEERTDIINAMLVLAASLGLLSMYAFIASAVTVVQTLRA